MVVQAGVQTSKVLILLRAASVVLCSGSLVLRHGRLSGLIYQWTLQENRNAFARILFRPRILIDVSKIDMTTTILGFKISMPIMVAPTAMQKMLTRKVKITFCRKKLRRE